MQKTWFSRQIDFFFVVFLGKKLFFFCAKLFFFYCSFPCKGFMLFSSQIDFFFVVFLAKDLCYFHAKLTFLLLFSLQKIQYIFVPNWLFLCKDSVFSRQVEFFTLIFLAKDSCGFCEKMTFLWKFSLQNTYIIFAQVWLFHSTFCCKRLVLFSRQVNFFTADFLAKEMLFLRQIDF